MNTIHVSCRPLRLRPRSPLRHRRPRAPSPAPRRAPRPELIDQEGQTIGWRRWLRAAVRSGMGVVLRWLTMVLQAMGR
jgi:hypothetical protein